MPWQTLKLFLKRAGDFIQQLHRNPHLAIVEHAVNPLSNPRRAGIELLALRSPVASQVNTLGMATSLVAPPHHEPSIFEQSHHRTDGRRVP